MTKKYAIVVLIVGLAAFGFIAAEPDFFFKINKSIDIFGRVYRELTLNYVDEPDPEKLMRSGIEGLLGSLDPYTTFIGEGEGDDVDLLATGRYGGIGVTISVRDGYVTITSLMEGYSAHRQGLQTGDRIVEVEGTSVIGAKPDQVRSMTRGEPGTIVHLKVEREGEEKPVEFALVREEIRVRNISYADFLGADGIAYVRLERFSRGAGDELRVAIKDLQLKTPVKGLILDLRENPGGLLDAAVEVVNKFVPQGSLVVSTRGRQAESEKKYFAREEPVLRADPLVVLINRNSASASEIVAGAVQDLDRGVILGTRTFGKGLVQTVTPLAYNTQLKVTTAKYYTPSGRSIQEIDYMHRGRDGVFAVTPDSLRREFRTARGRKVFELGGISPDTVVETPEPSVVRRELVRKSMFFSFATMYAAGHKSLVDSDEELLQGFRKFVRDKKFSYKDPAQMKFEELRDIAKESGYAGTTITELDKLSDRIETEKEKAFDRHRSEILVAVKMEIASRYEGERGRISRSLPGDQQVQTAARLLKERTVYNRLLGVR